MRKPSRKLTKAELKHKARLEFDKQIRAKYGSITEWKQKEFFSMRTLKSRGWNKQLMDKHLGERDETTSGAFRACDLWLKKRVLAAEKLPEVKASIKATNKRAEQLAEADMEARAKVKAEVAKWPIKLISKAEALRRLKPSKRTKREKDFYSYQEIINAAKAEMEPLVLAQPKYHRLFRGYLRDRIQEMIGY